MSKTYVKNYTNSFNIRGIEISVNAPARFDCETNQIVADTALDDQALALARAQYRKQYNVVTPQEIKALRQKWHLTQREFAKVVGWSPSTVALYETGELPTTGNNRLLKILIKDEQVMREFITDSQAADLLEN